MATNFIDLTEETPADFDIEFETNLIEIVKQEYVLYIKNHPQRKSMLHNDVAWLRISQILRTTTVACINKWHFMLQKFFHFSRLELKGLNDPDGLNWPHYNTFKELQQDMVGKYVDLIYFKINLSDYPRVKTDQIEAFLQEMETHGQELMSLGTCNAVRQRIWDDIAKKLNKLENGAQLPVVHWQMVWWAMKKKILLRENLEINNKAEDIRILKICGVSTLEEDRFKEVLESYIEFDNDTDQCMSFAGKYISNETILFCDICLRAPLSSSFDTTNWSLLAKKMIPSVSRNKMKLSTCEVCRANLKRQASLNWKACRICAQDNVELEVFLESPFRQMRQSFFNATGFTCSLSDGLPCRICSKCLLRLVEFNKFYMDFTATQLMLQEMHEKQFIGTNKRRICYKEFSDLLAEKAAKRICLDSKVLDLPENVQSKDSHTIDNPLKRYALPSQLDKLKVIPKKMKHAIGLDPKASPFLDVVNNKVSNRNKNQPGISRKVYSPIGKPKNFSQPNVYTNREQSIVYQSPEISITIAAGSVSNTSTPETNLEATQIPTSQARKLACSTPNPCHSPQITIEKVDTLMSTNAAPDTMVGNPQTDIIKPQINTKPTPPPTRRKQKLITVIPTSELLEKRVTNPMLQGLLDRPNSRLSSTSTGQMVEIIKSTKFVDKKIGSNEPLDDSTTKNDQPENLATPSPTEKPRSTLFEEEVIIIRDDSPPRETKPNMMQIDLGSVMNSLNPFNLYRGSLDCEEPEFISPSFLIDFAVNKAYRRDTRPNVGVTNEREKDTIANKSSANVNEGEQANSSISSKKQANEETQTRSDPEGDVTTKINRRLSRRLRNATTTSQNLE